jgi:hypothetical protein
MKPTVVWVIEVRVGEDWMPTESVALTREEARVMARGFNIWDGIMSYRRRTPTTICSVRSGPRPRRRFSQRRVETWLPPSSRSLPT